LPPAYNPCTLIATTAGYHRRLPPPVHTANSHCRKPALCSNRFALRCRMIYLRP
jgi:hypothetical protein